MRIRQIKPAYWTDALLQKELSPAEREFYIGLWMLADDGAWLRWDVSEVAGELYRYQPTQRREKAVARHGAKLESLGRIELWPCGHAHIPTMTLHQRFAAETKRVYTIKLEHEARCLSVGPQVPAETRGSPLFLARNGPVGGVKEPDGQDDDLDANDRLAADPEAEEYVQRAARKAISSRNSRL